MKRQITIDDGQDELIIKIPARGNSIPIAFMGVWCALWVVIFYNIVKEGLIFQYSGLYIHMIWFFILWLFVLRIFLWKVNGTERIRVDKTHLTIKRLGTFLTATRKFELDLVDEFQFTDDIKVPWLIRQLGFAGGHIVFNYWERPEYFGQSLRKSEAEQLLVRLNTLLKKFASERQRGYEQFAEENPL